MGVRLRCGGGALSYLHRDPQTPPPPHNSSTHGHTAPAGLIPDDDHEEEEEEDEEEEEEEDGKDFVVSETKHNVERGTERSWRGIQQQWPASFLPSQDLQ